MATQEPFVQMQGFNYKGQTPDEGGLCFCSKQNKWMKATQFYSYKDGSHPKMCKQCMTMFVDNFNPQTFTWILKDLDLPYVEPEWNNLRDREFAKEDPKHPGRKKPMTGMSVLGKYISKMKLKQWREFGWADSQDLVLGKIGPYKNKLPAAPKEKTEEEKAADKKFQEQLRRQLAEGTITQAQYKTMMPVEVQAEEQPIATSTQQMYSQSGNFFDQSQYMKEEQLPDPSAQLTKQDKIKLAMKWGRQYKPSEWVALQQDYAKMMQSFDIQDADTKNSLILICKLNLKANQALDSGDYDSFKKLSSELSSQRKLANFAASARKKQQEKKQQDVLTSVGQLVAYCEKNGGRIPPRDLSVSQDIIDTVIQDQKQYLKTLIEDDPSLAKEIEDYIKKREIYMQQKQSEADAQAAGKDHVQIDDKDIADYNDFIRQDMQLDKEQESE